MVNRIRYHSKVVLLRAFLVHMEQDKWTDEDTDDKMLFITKIIKAEQALFIRTNSCNKKNAKPYIQKYREYLQFIRTYAKKFDSKRIKGM